MPISPPCTLTRRHMAALEFEAAQNRGRTMALVDNGDIVNRNYVHAKYEHRIVATMTYHKEAGL